MPVFQTKVKLCVYVCTLNDTITATYAQRIRNTQVHAKSHAENV